MHKHAILFLVAAAFIAAVVGTSFFRYTAQTKRYVTTMLTYNVGKGLIETTNSSFVVAIGPDLRAQLSRLVAPTTHIASVRVDDEAAPVGDGRASSRIVLTNALTHGLGIRLRLGSDAAGQSRFSVLGYWTFSGPVGSTNRNQLIRSETYRTSSATDSKH